MTTNNAVNVPLAGNTGTGNFVGANTPTLITPVLGAATATSVNGATITATTGGTLTLANSSTLVTSGAHSLTLTTTADSNVTFPTSGTLITSSSIPSAATQADQETGTSTTTYVSPGRQQYHQSAAKAWLDVTFSGGTPSLIGHYNVSSLVDNGTGNTSANLTVAFSGATYSAVGNINAPGTYGLSVTRVDDPNGIVFYSATGTIASPTQADFDFSIAAYGDQA